MRSPRQLYIEAIEQVLKHPAAFQLHAARHKVLLIRDTLAEDQAYCEALLLKIDDLLGEAFSAVNRPTLLTTATQAPQHKFLARPNPLALILIA